MNWKDELLEEMGYTICPICFPEYVYCDEDCEHCKEYIDFKQFYERRKIEMCKYCEIDNFTDEAKRNIRKNQRVKIKIVRNMLNENLYYLEVDTNSYQKEEISINYCPMCGRRLGE